MSEQRPSFTVSQGDPDEIDLELLELGGVPPADAARIRAAAAGPLRPAAAALARDRRAFFAPRRSSGPLLRASLAIAALSAVGVAIGGWWAGPRPEVRPKGGLPVDVAASRGGAPVALSELHAGDRLTLGLVAPDDGVIHVVTVEADGGVSVLEPGRVVSRGDRFALDGAAELDDHAGREWLVVTLDGHPADVAALGDRARALLPDPTRHQGPRTWVLDVTRAAP